MEKLTQRRKGAESAKGFRRDERVVRNEGLGGGAWRAFWERGRLARRAALARGDTLILAFSHEGRRDPLAADGAWFRGAGLGCKHLDSRFRGNDGGTWEKGSDGWGRRLVSDGIRR